MPTNRYLRPTWTFSVDLNCGDTNGKYGSIYIQDITDVKYNAEHTLKNVREEQMKDLYLELKRLFEGE